MLGLGTMSLEILFLILELPGVLRLCLALRVDEEAYESLLRIGRRMTDEVHQLRRAVEVKHEMVGESFEIRQVMDTKRVFVFKEDLATEPRFYYFYAT